MSLRILLVIQMIIYINALHIIQTYGGSINEHRLDNETESIVSMVSLTNNSIQELKINQEDIININEEKEEIEKENEYITETVSQIDEIESYTETIINIENKYMGKMNMKMNETEKEVMNVLDERILEEAQIRKVNVSDNVVSTTTTTTPPNQCNLTKQLIEEIASYAPIVDKIADYVMKGDYKGRTFDTLAMLVDTYGPRISGSGILEAAIDWVIQLSHEEGLKNVHTEDVKVPHWVRNNESLWLKSPRVHELSILGLGSSVGTPPGGIVAEVLVVSSFDDLKDNADKAVGKIVLFNPEWESYDVTVQYRSRGASVASAAGAVAALVRSVTPYSINSPHTGIQDYDVKVKKIPVACVTVEDAEMIGRMQKRGQKIVVHFNMGAINYPDIISRNTIIEIPGNTLSDETVVMSGHIDSWDVGQGAMDDGGGAFISWNSAAVLHRLGLQAKRSIHTVLFTGEEQGLYGGQAYFEKHIDKRDKYQLLLESDIGTFNPLGLAFSGNDEANCMIEEIMKLMTPFNATKVVNPMDGGPDIIFWKSAGVPTGSLYNDNGRYFWFHHSNGDMMTVEDTDTLDKCTALWASVAYVAADISAQIPR